MESKELVELTTEFKKAKDEVQALAVELKGRMEKGEKASETLKGTADEALTKMNGLVARLEDVEQKAARQVEKPAAAKSIGAQFVEHESFKNLQNAPQQRGRASMQVKATITLATTDANGSAGDLVQSTRLPGVLELPQRRLTVRDLISSGRMDGNTLEYIKETGFVNNAAMVAETAVKPMSDIKFDQVTTSAKVIAHYFKASKQVLSDASQLASIIDQRLRYGIALKEEEQLLSGDGTGQNLLGIVPQATAYTAPITVAGATSIDMMRLAALQATLAQYPATGIVMHPSDWAWVELLKDTTGRYIIGNPQGSISPTLWGLPVVASQAMAVDKFLVGAFKMGAQLFDRWDASVTVATENEDDFIKNLVTILGEERLALAVYRPEAFIYGDFGRVA